jgi:hypothetical protein
MRYLVLLLAIACAPSLHEEAAEEPDRELSNEVEVVVDNRASDNVIVRACVGETCRRIAGVVRARGRGRGILTYETSISLLLEVQYVGRIPATWRSQFLFWIEPGMCIELDVQHYDMRQNNSVTRC